jgi:hypothetical protein
MANSNIDNKTLSLHIALFYLLVSFTCNNGVQLHIVLHSDSRNVIINAELENNKSWSVAVL